MRRPNTELHHSKPCAVCFKNFIHKHIVISEELQRIFKEIDTNSDGFLDVVPPVPISFPPIPYLTHPLAVTKAEINKAMEKARTPRNFGTGQIRSLAEVL